MDPQVMHSQTQFPRIRQLIKISAVACPLLLFSAFLMFAGGAKMWTLIPLIAALFWSRAFPAFIPEAPSQNPPASEADRPSRWGLQRLAEMLVFFWFIQLPLPELHALIDRLQTTHALSHWALVSGLGLMALSAILRGRRHTGLLTDQDIYSYYSMIKPPAAPTNKPESGDKSPQSNALLAPP